MYNPLLCARYCQNKAYRKACGKTSNKRKKMTIFLALNTQKMHKQAHKRLKLQVVKYLLFPKHNQITFHCVNEERSFVQILTLRSVRINFIRLLHKVINLTNQIDNIGLI